jgi:hypothetical protein
MIKKIGEVSLFNITCEKYFLEDIDNKILSEEVLEFENKEDKLEPNNIFSPGYEINKFNIKQNSQGEKLIKTINTIYQKENLHCVGYWSQIHQPLESSNTHTHTSLPTDRFLNIKSFVYYAKVPEKSGSICFVIDGIGYSPIDVFENLLLVFPSNIPHKVTKNMSNDIRISVSGNLSMEKI